MNILFKNVIKRVPCKLVCGWPSVNILFNYGYGMGRSDAAHVLFLLANEKSSEIVQCFSVLRVYMSRRALTWN